MTEAFDRDCRLCPRLVKFRDEVARENPGYYCRPVPPFGDGNAHLLVVGLAPGMHGANRTGRPFTGDYAGELLYATLHKFAFASDSKSLATDDGLTLNDCRITNAVKCLPPQNKPLGSEIDTCNRYLKVEIDHLAEDSVVLALGAIAHRAVLKAVGFRQVDYPFAHAAEHDMGGRFLLLDSYHCSRYNTNTGRLTAGMFHEVVARARALLPLRQ